MLVKSPFIILSKVSRPVTSEETVSPAESFNRRPLLSQTSPEKRELPGASFICRQNPRQHRPKRTAKGESSCLTQCRTRIKTACSLTIKPPKLRKNTAQRQKKRFCQQKPAAAAQHPKAHPARDHAKHPSTTKKPFIRRHPSPARLKSPRTFSKTTNMSRVPQ